MSHTSEQTDFTNDIAPSVHPSETNINPKSANTSLTESGQKKEKRKYVKKKDKKDKKGGGGGGGEKGDKNSLDDDKEGDNENDKDDEGVDENGEKKKKRRKRKKKLDENGDEIEDESKKNKNRVPSKFKPLMEPRDEAGRVEFIEEIWKLHEDKGQALRSVPLMKQKPLDLFKLYHIVKKYGGVEHVNKMKMWPNVCTDMGIDLAKMDQTCQAVKKSYCRYNLVYEAKYN